MGKKATAKDLFLAFCEKAGLELIELQHLDRNTDNYCFCISNQKVKRSFFESIKQNKGKEELIDAPKQKFSFKQFDVVGRLEELRVNSVDVIISFNKNGGLKEVKMDVAPSATIKDLFLNFCTLANIKVARDSMGGDYEVITFEETKKEPLKEKPKLICARELMEKDFSDIDVVPEIKKNDLEVYFDIAARLIPEKQNRHCLLQYF